jgi:hypothetical protein
VYTPPTSVAASNPCLNCGTNIQLECCPECGQREVSLDPTLREYLYELVADTLRRDGKVAGTLRELFTKPGALTVAYLEGVRVRYVSPVRLFLFTAVLYFVLAGLLPVPAARGVVSAIPATLLILVPAFAGIFAYAFRSRRRHYPQHLVFALHVHAVVFAGLTLSLLPALLPVAVLRVAVSAIVGVALFLHAIFAARRAYAGEYGLATKLTFALIAYGSASFGAAFLLSLAIARLK